MKTMVELARECAASFMARYDESIPKDENIYKGLVNAFVDFYNRLGEVNAWVTDPPGAEEADA